MQAQHEDDVGAILVHAAEVVAEGRVEVPADVLRAHLRDGRSMIVGGASWQGAVARQGGCSMSCGRTFITADWIP